MRGCRAHGKKKLKTKQHDGAIAAPQRVGCQSGGRLNGNLQKRMKRTQKKEEKNLGHTQKSARGAGRALISEHLHDSADHLVARAAATSAASRPSSPGAAATVVNLTRAKEMKDSSCTAASVP